MRRPRGQLVPALTLLAVLVYVERSASQPPDPTPTPTATFNETAFNGTATATPTSTPEETPGACNNGGARGWLEKVTDGFHPILPFGPSGLHGRTYGEELPNTNISITVTELSEDGAIPAAECCPQRYYPGRLYRILLSCPKSCAFLMSVEFNNSDLSLGTDSFQDQLGTWPDVSLNADPQVARFLGAKDYNSVGSAGQLSSSLSRSYSVLWYAPLWDRVSYSELQVRATVVLDLDTECPGYFITEQLPALIVCGDTYKDELEACDDGNLVDGDGCDSSCAIEVGWTCDGREAHPSTGLVMSACTKTAINIFPQELTMEEGTTVDYFFNLTTYVTSEVYLQLNNPNQGELAVVGSPIFKITPADWNRTRAISVEVLPNSRMEGSRSYVLTHDISGNDPNWDLPLGTIPDVRINVTDNDAVGVELSRADINLVELGDLEIYAVSLSSQPVGFVQIAITHEPADFSLLISPSVLLFDAENWDLPQDVILQAPDNNDITGPVALTILHEVNSVQDPAYNFNRTLHTINVTVEDNDVPGLRVLPRNVAITEAAQEGGNYTISLLSQPAFGYTVIVHTNATCESPLENSCSLVSLGPDGAPRAVLGRSNWDLGVKMTVRNLDNSYADGARVGTVLHTVESGDPDFADLQSQSPQAPWAVSVAIMDDDLAAIFHPEALELSEGSPPLTFSLSLSTIPYADVSVTLALSDDTWLELSPSAVEWTPAQWREPRNISITPKVDDVIFRGAIEAAVIMVSSSPDPSYEDILQMPIPVSLLDNDVAGVDLSVDNAVPIELAEGAPGRTLDVTLTSQPLSPVHLIFSTGTQIHVSPTEMFFSGSNYTLAQPLEVRPVDDVLVEEVEHFDRIRIQVESADPGYQGVDVVQVVRIAENDLIETSKPVDRWGGQICPTYPCGDVTLTVPPLAIREGSNIGLTVAVEARTPTVGVAVPVQGSTALRVSSIIAFEPHNTTFARPVYIAMAYDQVAAAEPGYVAAFFMKADQLSIGWRRQAGGTFTDGMAILPTDHLSLYFVGIVPQDAVFIIDDDAPEELQCPEDTVELQMFATVVALGAVLGLEVFVLLLSGIWYWFTWRRSTVVPYGASRGKSGMLMIEGPAKNKESEVLSLEGPVSEFEPAFTGEPPLPEDRPVMVGKAGGAGPSGVRQDASLQ